MNEQTVIIAKQPNAMREIFRILDLEKKLENKKNILIKVNLRAAAVSDFTPCAITSFEITKELAEMLSSLGKKIAIVEGTSSKIMTKQAIERSGFKKLTSTNIRVVNLNTQPVKKIGLPASPLKFLEIYQPVFDADFIISLPVMKTHTATLVSLAMKNLMGLVCETSIHKIHLMGLHEPIAELAKIINPNLSLIDATEAMEGTGPVLGTCLRTDTLIAGFDLLAVDSIASKMMGYEPNDIKHLFFFKEKIGRSQTEEIKIIGELRNYNFRKPDHGLVSDMYNYKIFNWLVSKKIIHWLVYDKFYFILKETLNYLRKKDEPRK